MGFRDAAHVSGRHPRLASRPHPRHAQPRARELLTKLMPGILKALAATADPDAAFAQFDRFLSNLPAGVQLFSLFLARPQFLRPAGRDRGLGAAAGAAIWRAIPPPWMRCWTRISSARLPSRAELDARFASAATRQLRRRAGRRRAALPAKQIFRVGVQIVEGAAKAEQAGPALADIAESVIAGLLPRVEDELAAGAGRVPGGGFAVVAMGKLGGREMTASSDLDLVFVYDAPAGRGGIGRRQAAVAHRSISRGWRSG